MLDRQTRDAAGEGDRRRQVTDAIGSALAELQAAYDDRDDALARRLGIHRSDLRCLDLIIRHGPSTPAEIARALRLTPGSVTALLDRLERAGHAERTPHPSHGKKLLVVPTAELVATIQGPLFDHIRDAEDDLTSYSTSELELIHGYLETVCRRQQSIREALSQPAE